MDGLITVDPEIMGGIPVFAGTRVPVATLFEYLKDNFTLQEFVEHFPTVSFDQAKSLLSEASQSLTDR